MTVPFLAFEKTGCYKAPEAVKLLSPAKCSFPKGLSVSGYLMHTQAVFGENGIRIRELGQEWTFVHAKSEIVHKVCDIVKKQLAVCQMIQMLLGESKFTNTCEDILEVSGKNG
ncbi:hypothetical protein P8452_54995 [Trifolium repens]|nr:hypothetical protein P8452_54995 [Trifolium repens]